MRQFTLKDLNKVAEPITGTSYSFDLAGSVCEKATCTVEGCQDNQKVATAIKQGNAQFVLSSDYKKLKTDKEELELNVKDLQERNDWQSKEISKLAGKVLQSAGVVGRTDIEPVARRDSKYGCPIVFQVNGFNVEGVVGRSITKQTVEITADALGDLLARLDNQATTIRSQYTEIEDYSKQLDTLQQTVVRKNQEIAGLSERNRVLQQAVSTNNTARIDAEQRAIVASRDLSNAYAEIRKVRAELRDEDSGLITPATRLGKIALALNIPNGTAIYPAVKAIAAEREKSAATISTLRDALTNIRNKALKDIMSPLPTTLVTGKIDWHQSWFNSFDVVSDCDQIASIALQK